MSTLTRKQELFIIKWFETDNKTEAYKIAYNTSNMKEETINSKACLLSKEGKVRARYEELKQEAYDKLKQEAIYTFEDLSINFKKAMKRSFQLDNMSSAINANKELGIIHNLYPKGETIKEQPLLKVEVVNPVHVDDIDED